LNTYTHKVAMRNHSIYNKEIKLICEIYSWILKQKNITQVNKYFKLWI